MWMFVSAFFLLSPHFTPKDLSLFIYMLLIMPWIFSMMHKNNTAFWPILVHKGTLSSILTDSKLANDMPAY